MQHIDHCCIIWISDPCLLILAPQIHIDTHIYISVNDIWKHGGGFYLKTSHLHIPKARCFVCCLFYLSNYPVSAEVRFFFSAGSCCVFCCHRRNNNRKGSTHRQRFICQAAKKYGVTGCHVRRWWAQKDCLKDASQRKPLWKPPRDWWKSDYDGKNLTKSRKNLPSKCGSLVCVKSWNN